MKSTLELITATAIGDLELYRMRLFAAIKKYGGYKGDCGNVEIQLPGVTDEGYETENLTLHVRCNPLDYSYYDDEGDGLALVIHNGRSNYYTAPTLLEAVKLASDDLLRAIALEEERAAEPFIPDPKSALGMLCAALTPKEK